MTKHEFNFDGQRITSIVMEESEFNELINFMKENIDKIQDIKDARTGRKTTKSSLDAVQEAKVLPLMEKGTKTQFLFEKYEVKTQYLSICQQGYARRTYGIGDA